MRSRAINDIWQHRIDRDAGTSTVTLSGELDMSASGHLTRILVGEVARPGTTAVQADLGAVDFIDSSVINALVCAYRTAALSGRSFVVCRPHHHVRRVLDVTGVLGALSAGPAAG